MAKVRLQPDTRQFIYRVARALVDQGWRLRQIPSRGELAYNRQRLQLETPDRIIDLRLHLYKIGQSGRSKPYERRIEITSTFEGGRLARVDVVTEAVLGYDAAADTFVGFDPRRLEHGGHTQNASSFFDQEGLRLASDREIHTLPRESDLFGTEYHAFFRPARIAEYLVNLDGIHKGAYRGQGAYSPLRRPRGGELAVEASLAKEDLLIVRAPRRGGAPKGARQSDVAAYEAGRMGRLARRKITPEEFLEIQRRFEEIGLLGEKLVLDEERRRLRAAGADTLADQVRWISQESIAEGFDILSYEPDGAERFIEVKATVRSLAVFQITRREWDMAASHRSRYFIARVTDTRGEANIAYLQDPIALEAAGTLTRVASGWQVTINE